MSNGWIIEVENLTKRYAGNTAVEGITFSVQRGEIVGFLGLNGAGKSTTMRILSGFIPATAGWARVAGFDVSAQTDEVRRRIGYMPENNPLHLDMRVREYLKFRARLKGLGIRHSRERVEVVMGQCGLTEVSRRIIGTGALATMRRTCRTTGSAATSTKARRAPCCAAICSPTAAPTWRR